MRYKFTHGSNGRVCGVELQSFCGNAQGAEVAIILNSGQSTRAPCRDVAVSTHRTSGDADDDEADRLQRSHVVSDTGTVAGKVNF